MFFGRRVDLPIELTSNDEDDVRRTLQLLEPRLRRLTVLVTDGTPMIYGNIGIGSLVPVPHMGEGVVRLLIILLALAAIRMKPAL